MLRFTDEDFARMLQGNKNLKVSGKSAGRQKGAAPGAPAGAAKKPAGKPATEKKSPHAQELLRLKNNPELIKGREEHFIQVEVFYWLECEHPDIYRLTHSTPNSGKRGKLVAFTMQSEGQKAGYPDMSLDAARGAYHGLRVELKTQTGKPSDDQESVAKLLREQGYCVIFSYGLDATKRAFMDYWSLPAGQALPDQYK